MRDGSKTSKEKGGNSDEKPLLKFNRDTIEKYKITWKSFKANYLERYPEDKQLLADRAVSESTFGMLIYPSKPGVSWDTFRKIVVDCAEYFAFKPGTTFLDVADGDVSLIPPRMAKKPIRGQESVADDATPHSQYLLRSLVVATAVLLVTALWLSVQLSRVSGSLQVRERKHEEQQETIERKNRQLDEVQRQTTAMETTIEKLSASNSILSADNARLRSVDHAMDLIRRLDFDEPPKALHFLSPYLAEYEPAIFYKSADGFYDIARIVPDRVSLGGETDFVREFQGARKSFDMFANVAGVVKEHLPVIEEGLRRGVNYRLIISDYRTENDRLHPFLVDVGQGGAGPAREVLRIHHSAIDELKKRVEDDKNIKGRFDVRWNAKLLLHTMWIRDGTTPEAIAHLGVHFYGGKPTWPSFRITRRTADEVIEKWIQEFEVIWEFAQPYETIPAPTTAMRPNSSSG